MNPWFVSTPSQPVGPDLIEHELQKGIYLMYGRVLAGGTVAALPLTGFYTGMAVILAVILLVLGGVLVRISYLKHRASTDS